MRCVSDAVFEALQAALKILKVKKTRARVTVSAGRARIGLSGRLHG